MILTDNQYNLSITSWRNCRKVSGNSIIFLEHMFILHDLLPWVTQRDLHSWRKVRGVGFERRDPLTVPLKYHEVIP
jgi:hypothetical protein